MTRETSTSTRRTALKGLGATFAGVAGSAVGVSPVAAATVNLDCYVYINNSPMFSSTSELDEMADDAEWGLDNFLTDVESSGHCDMTHDIHSRWQTQRDQGLFPSLSSNDNSAFRSWLRDQGWDEGDGDGGCATHVLIRHEDGAQGGGNSVGGVWPDYYYFATQVYRADKAGSWNRITAQHEVGHAMVDSSLQYVKDRTHADVSNCPENDSSETIHNREHTLGTAVSDGKTVMAHRSPSAAECTGDGNGSGVGGDNAHGTGISPGKTSHAADKCFGESKRQNS
jgi:hypothetical protein